MPSPFYVIDFETTGINPQWNRVIEVAVVKIIDGEIKDHFQGKTTIIETKELINQKTRQYAKRQFTWARGHMKSWETIYSTDLDDLFRKAINKIS